MNNYIKQKLLGIALIILSVASPFLLEGDITTLVFCGLFGVGAIVS